MVLKLQYKIFFLVALLLFSCNDGDHEETSRLESVSPFDAVELNGVFHVYLIEDSTFSVSISGFGDTPQNISVSVENNTLNITDNSNNKWLHPETNKIKLFIHSNPLRVITVHATCYFETINPITSDQFSLINGGETKLMEGRLDLNCNYFQYWNSHLCGGKITLRGNTNSLIVNTFSTASVDALNLVAHYAYIENNSKGDCEIFVKDRLEYSIKSTGNIYLSGNPPEIILNERTSSGQLILR